MTDAPAAIDTPADNGGSPPPQGGDQGGTPAQGGTPQASASREWMQALPDDLKADQTLSRYENVDSLSRAFLEQKKELSTRLHIPAADAPPEQWGAVYDALGRPKDIAEYDVPIMEGIDPETTKPYRELAHQIGLNPAQAKALAEFDMQRMQAAVDERRTKGEADLQALKDKLGGEYEAKKSAASAAFLKVFGDNEQAAAIADNLAEKLGDANAVEGFMKLAAMIGEHGRVDGTGEQINGVSDAQAEARLKELQKDAAWREKLTKGDVTVKAEYDRLLAAAQRHEVSKIGA